MLRRKEFHRPGWIVALTSTVRPIATPPTVAAARVSSSTAVAVRRTPATGPRNKTRGSSVPCPFGNNSGSSVGYNVSSRWLHIHHAHHPPTSASREGYDPELAACMDRWVRLVSSRLFPRPKAQSRVGLGSFTRRRMCTSSSQSRSAGSTTPLIQGERAAVELETEGIAGSEHAIQRASLNVLAVDDSAIPPSTTSALPNTPQHQHHSASYLHFRRQLKSLARKVGRDAVTTRKVRRRKNGHQPQTFQDTSIQPFTSMSPEDVERIWLDYTQIAQNEGNHFSSQSQAGGRYDAELYHPPALSLKEYEQLMDFVRHSHEGSDGASERRVLQLYDDARSIGLVPTTQMYTWTVSAAFGVMASSTTVKAIYDDFVRSHIHHRKGATAGASVKDGWRRDQEQLLKAIVNGFAFKSMVLHGIDFLDKAVHYEDSNLVQSLYAQLIQAHFASEENHNACLTSQPKDTDRDRIVNFFRRNESFVYSRIKKLMSQLENAPDGPILIKELSSHGLSSLLVQLREQRSLGAVLLSLLRQSQLDEAVRLLDIMVDKDIAPPLNIIRTRLIRFMSSDKDSTLRERQERILHEWDDATGRRGLFEAGTLNTMSDEREIDIEHDPLTPASRAREWTQQPQLRWELEGKSTQEYEAMIESLIRDQDLGTAVDAAKYFAHRGWQSQHLDVKQLNSFMINHATSDQFIQYFHVRYLLGPATRPDLHSFRRFIYASCRRSDLYTALSLLQILRTTHPEWRLDASLYNPIISAASAIPGRMAVAEKMVQAMRQSGVRPDLYTYHALLNGYANTGDLKAAKSIPPQMVQHGFEPTTRTFNLIIKAYLRSRNDISTSRRLLKIMERSSKDVGPDHVTINMLLEAYSKAGNAFWTDPFFDNYIASMSGQTLPEALSFGATSQGSDSKSQRLSARPLRTQHSFDSARPKVKVPTHQKDGDPDYHRIYATLKLALWKTDMPVEKVWSLWKSVKDYILAPSNLPATFVPFTKVIHSSSNSTTSAPSSSSGSTHASKARPATPPKTAVTRTMSDADYFKWTTLQLFWHAFRQQGDLPGVKMINRLALDLFPDKALTDHDPPSTSSVQHHQSNADSNATLFSTTWSGLSRQLAAQTAATKQGTVERQAASHEISQAKQSYQHYLKRAEARREKERQVATRERFGANWTSHKQSHQHPPHHDPVEDVASSGDENK